jgi:hypothetical protein
MTQTNFDFDLKEYENLLKAVASMSRLYSNNDMAFIHSRFVEKLYVHCSKAEDLSRSDMSFDAKLGDIGVGVKTFVTSNISIGKSEKVAEFTKNASLGDFKGLTHQQNAIKSSVLRNNRVVSDANEYEIDMSKSIYHCLVRTTDFGMIHEEPYQLINIDNIKPTDNRGNEVSKFSEEEGHTYFTDGISKYTYNVSKNVLYKKFELNSFKNSHPIRLKIYDDIFQKILEWTKFTPSKEILVPPSILKEQHKETSLDFVILPLYSTRNKNVREVPTKSGMNQWNAGGRERKFGESYIPVPRDIHHKYPNFFPNKDVKFKLKLPNGKIILAKLCQEGSKALMSDPNTDLCEWLYNIIDKNRTVSNRRFLETNPYTYDDLKSVGKDSIKVTKVIGKDYEYEIESTNLGSYELFINDEQNELEED